jgi:hypothetical protein
MRATTTKRREAEEYLEGEKARNIGENAIRGVSSGLRSICH